MQTTRLGTDSMNIAGSWITLLQASYEVPFLYDDVSHGKACAGW